MLLKVNIIINKLFLNKRLFINFIFGVIIFKLYLFYILKNINKF